jgi:hypothetical protein
MNDEQQVIYVSSMNSNKLNKKETKRKENIKREKNQTTTSLSLKKRKQ